MAHDRGADAAAVILSGTGTDGTLGAQEIKAKGGLVLVQSEDSAGYDGMPRSAVSSGVADIIVAPEEMPQRLSHYFSHPENKFKKQLAAASDQRDWLNKIFAILRTQIGHDFSLYKENTLLRRINRRMELNQIAHHGQYVRYLRENPAEIQALFRELLIGVTNFFRDTASFHALKANILPDLLDRLENRRHISGLDSRLLNGRRGLFPGDCDPRTAGHSTPTISTCNCSARTSMIMPSTKPGKGFFRRASRPMSVTIA